MARQEPGSDCNGNAKYPWLFTLMSAYACGLWIVLVDMPLAHAPVTGFSGFSTLRGDTF